MVKEDRWLRAGTRDRGVNSFVSPRKRVVFGGGRGEAGVAARIPPNMPIFNARGGDADTIEIASKI